MLFTDGPGLEGVGLDKEREPIPSTSGLQMSTPMEVEPPLRDDGGFGGQLDQNIMCNGIFLIFNETS